MAFFDMNLFGPSITSLISLSIALVVYLFGKQPDPYMDEIFHIPQVQKYCAHRFDEWDPMITTLPGLYFCSWAFMEILAVFFHQDVKIMCMPLFLRMVNVIFNFGNIWVMYRIVRKLDEMNPKNTPTHSQSEHVQNLATTNSNDAESWQKFYHMASGITLGMFPLLFFFMFLYYTDNGSTFFVLLMYYLSLGDYHVLAAIIGMYAFFFRQTNIVWVIFTAGVTAVRMYEPYVLRKLGPRANDSLNIVLEFVKQLFVNMKATVHVLWPYALVMLFFITFLIVNGGIAVGDKNHHKVCFNFPQIFYFACFASFFGFPHLSSPAVIYNTFLYFIGLNQRRYYSTITVLVCVVYYLVKNFTYVHPYMLADNRHYSFYIWKNIYLTYPEAKVGLIPVYIVATTMIFVAINQSRLWKIVYAVCVAMVLIPQGLLEFRYFIIPYLMFRLHVRTPPLWILGGEFLIYACINYFTLWMFLNKPFKWPNSDDVQRFMW
ncbi:putative Dol-P-Glc:Glc(2)Man(9)GlcNAc(2)-PP-Dol alpha-1,2-glucosyltransferase [Xenia sp. Carnegie-2017]|uniref:putative Dol-P-Glc:Glc(2)Man(9)GlcNAc(2)-PP-Dol alpha-1,2-glucosyltransferase n=1 Tax=Xenia sp. Carnegie-2017 TaxID=2897299 RepID=UPI001F038D50|nr:putative Dol-P-Glc:Glc(2)Man(9)GlcNAc(2)-PP-Dol alpha-1,2-glucosyltransferase [Xenia sp. Carnegie-2017]